MNGFALQFPSETTAAENVASRGGDLASVDISIVMPCLNEAETLADCILEATRAIAESGLNGEVVIADNGSSDGSPRIAAEHGARVVNVAAKGYGNALRGGIEASRGESVVMADADGSYDFSHAPRLVAKLNEGFDLVMGNRFLGGIQPGAMPWKHRYIGNPVLSGIGRLFFRCPAGDFHCGLRAFRRTAYDAMELNTTGMEFASEMVIKATLKGMRVTEVPTVLRPDGRSRPPHLNSWRDGWRHLRFMLLFCPRWLFVVPALLAIVVGLALVSIIAMQGTATQGTATQGTATQGTATQDTATQDTATQGIWWIGEIGLSVNTAMAGAMLLILGSQILLGGVFARQLSVATGHLPQQNLVHRTTSWWSLELGVAWGLGLLGLGAAMFGNAFWIWRSVDFGPLEPTTTLRWVIPSITLMILGTQVVFGSFLLSLIGLCCRGPGSGRRSVVGEER